MICSSAKNVPIGKFTRKKRIEKRKKRNASSEAINKRKGADKGIRLNTTDTERRRTIRNAFQNGI